MRIGVFAAAILLVASPALANHVIYSFPMESDPAWSTEGQWAFGVPTGQGGAYGGPDPTSGYTGSHAYGYNLNGDYPNYLIPTKWLTTAALDFTGFADVELHFYRWLGVEAYCYDQVWLEVSNDGVNWDVLWHNPDG